MRRAALSKRVRYEVLARDGHACRYCGATAPNAQLVVDHVIPVALGGSDDPSNLVAACNDCNAGKTSVHPDGEKVAQVAQDAERWADAYAAVSAMRRQEAVEREGNFGEVLHQWARLEDLHRTGPCMPDGWERSIAQFLTAGLDVTDLVSIMPIAFRAGHVPRSAKWRYFCGICWTEIRNRQEATETLLRSLEANDE